MTRTVLVLSAPLMLNNLIQTIYNLTDTYWVSRLGDISVAAVSLVWPVIFLMISLGIGLSVAGTALVSQYVGAGETGNAAQSAGQVLTFGLLFSVIIGAAGYMLTPHVIGWMGAGGELYAQGVEFLQIIFLGMPFMFGFQAYTCILQGQGDTVSPMVFGILSVALNMVLDPLMILTLNMGIAGAAWATVISRLVFCVIAVYSLFAGRWRKGIKLHLAHLKPVAHWLSKIAKVGMPASLGQSSAALGFVIMNAFIVGFGDNTLAAFGIGNRINSLVLMPAMGIGSALATIVGQNIGYGDIPRVSLAVRRSLQLSVSMSVVGGIILFLLAGFVMDVFTDSPDVYAQGVEYLQWICAGIFLMAIFQVFVGVFQGSGHTVMAMILMAGRLLMVRIPLIVLLSRLFDIGSRAIWYSLLLSNAVACIVGAAMYLGGRWKRAVIHTSEV